METPTKNIDKIFKTKLESLDAKPTSLVWSKLNSKLKINTRIVRTTIIGIILAGIILWLLGPSTDSQTLERDFEPVYKISNINQTDFKEESKVSIQEEYNLLPTEMSKLTDKINYSQISKEVSLNVLSNNPNRDSITSESAEPIFIKSGVEKLDHINFDEITPENVSNKEVITPDIEISVPPIDFKKSIFSISIEAGINSSWKNMNAESSYESLKDYRLENENASYNLSFGILLNYSYKNLVFSTGINYLTFSERINYNISETIVDPDGGYYDFDTITLMIYDESYQLVPRIIGYDRTWVNEYIDIEHSYYNTNTYTYIEVPIQIGYIFNFNKVSVCPISGISLGILYGASGFIPTSNDNLDFIDLSKESNYLKPVISNINFGLQVEYLITPNYGVYIKPYYKHGLNSIYNNYPLNIYYRNAGVNFGINFYL